MVDVPDGDDEMSLAWEAGGGLCVMSRADAEFIVDARTALPKALDALEAVLALWPDADPCDCCVHVDCELVRAIRWGSSRERLLHRLHPRPAPRPPRHLPTVT